MVFPVCLILLRCTTLVGRRCATFMHTCTRKGVSGGVSLLFFAMDFACVLGCARCTADHAPHSYVHAPCTHSFCWANCRMSLLEVASWTKEYPHGCNVAGVGGILCLSLQGDQCLLVLCLPSVFCCWANYGMYSARKSPLGQRSSLTVAMLQVWAVFSRSTNVCWCCASLECSLLS